MVFTVLLIFDNTIFKVNPKITMHNTVLYFYLFLKGMVQLKRFCCLKDAIFITDYYSNNHFNFLAT